jgi:hypothetical protein
VAAATRWVGATPTPKASGLEPEALGRLGTTVAVPAAELPDGLEATEQL